MELVEKLALERRARLAAERLLDMRTRELASAEERLARQNRALIRGGRPARPPAHSGTGRMAPPTDPPHESAATAARAESLAPLTASVEAGRIGASPHQADHIPPQAAGPADGAADPTDETPSPAPPTEPPRFKSNRDVRPAPPSAPQSALPSGPSPSQDDGFWAASDLLQDGIALFDADLRLQGANRAFCTSFGITPPAKGESLATLLTTAAGAGLIRSEDRDLSSWLTAVSDTGIPGGPGDDTLLLQLSDGGWVRLTTRRTQGGALICQLVDITSQMRIWAALEAIPDGFVLFDREDRMVICNQSYRDIYKSSAEVMVPGVSFEEILRFGLTRGEYPEAQGQEERWINARLEEHRGHAAEGEHRLRDGRWLRSIDKETPDGGRVGLRVDITQLREQAVALEAAREAAEAANRAKSAFLANMSHEIRTPMNGVVGMAELLCDTALSDEQRLFAETIRSSGEALLVIINDILDYSKIEAERLTLHPADFDLERTIHEVVMLLQPRAREKGIDLMIDYDVFLPTRFTGDPGRLRQVLTNLIGNAVKFTEKGHVLTRIVGMEVSEGCHQLHVTVEDTGIGIPASLLDHVFGEFYQVDDEQNRRFEGTGLGLAISRRLIERMGGAVWVDSEYGKGSVFGFRLSLPLAENAEPARMPVAITSAMVVDDQFINRTILERQLAPCGVEVTLCRSGSEALQKIAGGARPDVVLTDHEMPGMDGITLAQQLREAGYDRPVLLLSSHTLATRESGAAPFTAMLQKPVLRAELYRLLTSLSEPALSPDAPLQGSAPVRQNRRAMRVLAAEDNRTNQLVLQKMLRHLDIELRFAGNGREAVNLWREFRPDMIFMDISMPEMDGKEATRTIRSDEAANGAAPTPIIALTAHMMEGDVATFLAAGMDSCLSKPLRRSEICAAVTGYQPKDCRPVDPEHPEPALQMATAALDRALPDSPQSL